MKFVAKVFLNENGRTSRKNDFVECFNKEEKTTTDVLVRSISFLSDTLIRIKHVAKLGTLT